MTFLYPAFLWSLGAVAVPVIIHLFNFRRYKKVYFTNVRFLKELQEETKSRSRLKEILVLICRCLALVCLVLAFAQPVLPREGASQQPAAATVCIYLDNSFSMQNLGSQGPLLDIAKTRARELVRHFGAGRRFHIITNDFEGRHQRLYSSDDALNLIDEIKASASPRRLTDAIKRQAEFLRGTGAAAPHLFLISDAQKSTFNLQELTPDTNWRYTIMPLSPNRTGNIYIDTCWFESPVQQKGFIQVLHAVIKNAGDATIESGSARLVVNEAQASMASFSLEPGGSAEVKFTFECRKHGFNNGFIRIEDFPVTFDDQLYFAFNAALNIRVCLISGPDEQSAARFTGLFANDSLYTLRAFSEKMIDYSVLRSSDLVVLNQLTELSTGLVAEIVQFSKQGGAVLFVPAAETDLQTSSSMLTQLNLPSMERLDTTKVAMDRISTESGFFAGVFERLDERLNVPVVNMHFSVRKKPQTESILALQNGDPFLVRAELNKAQIFMLTSPLNDRAGNFARHALFVPSMYRIAFSGILSSPLSYPVNTNVVIRIRDSVQAGEQPPHLRHVESKTEIIPETRVIDNNHYIHTRQQVSTPGYYELNREGRALLPLAFNYARLESDLAVHSPAELEGIVAARLWKNVDLLKGAETGLQAGFMEGLEGKKVWKLFILLALFFVLAEIALLRFLK